MQSLPDKANSDESESLFDFLDNDNDSNAREPSGDVDGDASAHDPRNAPRSPANVSNAEKPFPVIRKPVRVSQSGPLRAPRPGDPVAPPPPLTDGIRPVEKDVPRPLRGDVDLSELDRLDRPDNAQFDFEDDDWPDSDQWVDKTAHATPVRFDQPRTSLLRKTGYTFGALLVVAGIGSVFYSNPTVNLTVKQWTDSAIQWTDNTIAGFTGSTDDVADTGADESPLETPAVVANTNAPSSLNAKFKEELANLEGLLEQGNLDEADLAMQTMDRTIYGYGAPEFNDIKTRIVDLRQGGNVGSQALPDDTELAEADRLARNEDEQLADVGQQVEAARQEAAARAAEAERLAEAERVAEATRLAEAERVAEATRLAEAERVAEATRLAEAERVAEATRLAEAERIAEATRLAEAERVAETERLAEAERIAEAERLAEAERVAEAERLAEAERAAEIERTELERAAVAARQAEADRVAEVARQAEAEQVAEAARLAEAEQAAEEARRAEVQSAEAERLAASERAQDAQSVAQQTVQASAAAQVRADRLAQERARQEQLEVARQERVLADQQLAQQRAEQGQPNDQLAAAPESLEGIVANQREADDLQRLNEARERETQTGLLTPQTQPDSDPVISGVERRISDADLQQVYGRFAQLESAIENRDINAVIQLTQRSGVRIQQVMQMFENNTSIQAQLRNVSTLDANGEIQGTLQITRLTRADGSVTGPPLNLGSVRLSSIKEDDGWSSIRW